MKLDIDDLAEQAVHATRTRVPAMGAVRAAARRRSRRGRALIGATAVGVAASAVGVWAVLSRDDADTVSVVADGTNAPGVSTSEAGPSGERGIEGVLPSGEQYRVESDVLDTTVVGISAAIMFDGEAGSRAVGTATFRPAAAETQSAHDDGAGLVEVVSGDWVLGVSIYDDVRRALGDDAASMVASWIEPSEAPHPSGLPSFELSAPLRWASDDEVPVQMQVQYLDFVVSRGCATTAQACSDDDALQVIATEDVATPAPPWPGGTVVITGE